MMGDIGLAIFTPVVIAAATSVVSTRLIFGDERLFATPAFTMTSFRELFVYVVMGAVIGLFAAFFIRFFYLVQDFFTKLRFPRYLKPALGGLLVGLIDQQLH